MSVENDVRASRIIPALVAIGAAASAAAACGSSESPSRQVSVGITTPVAPMETIAETGGCGDAYFWAANAASTLAVTVSVDQRARSAVDPTVIVFTLPDPAVEVEVQRGGGLAPAFCTDVIDGNTWHVDERVPVTAGSGHVELAPRVSEFQCGLHGRMELTGATAEDGTRFGDVIVDTAGIGCYAG